MSPDQGAALGEMQLAAVHGEAGVFEGHEHQGEEHGDGNHNRRQEGRSDH